VWVLRSLGTPRPLFYSQNHEPFLNLINQLTNHSPNRAFSPLYLSLSPNEASRPAAAMRGPDPHGGSAELLEPGVASRADRSRSHCCAATCEAPAATCPARDRNVSVGRIRGADPLDTAAVRWAITTGCRLLRWGGMGWDGMGWDGMGL
jgi:hypothetical protein